MSLYELFKNFIENANLLKRIFLALFIPIGALCLLVISIVFESVFSHNRISLLNNVLINLVYTHVFFIICTIFYNLLELFLETEIKILNPPDEDEDDDDKFYGFKNTI